MQRLCAQHPVQLVLVGCRELEPPVRHDVASVETWQGPSLAHRSVLRYGRRWSRKTARAWNAEAAARIQKASSEGACVVLVGEHLLPFAPSTGELCFVLVPGAVPVATHEAVRVLPVEEAAGISALLDPQWAEGLA